jgi:hypothetical protein
MIDDDDRCGWCGGVGAIGYIPDDGELGVDCPACHGWGTETTVQRAFRRCEVCGRELDAAECGAMMGMCFGCASE